MLGIVLALSAALGFGTSAVLARLGLQHIRPGTSTFVSLVVGTVVMMTLALAIHLDDIRSLAAIAFAWFLLSGFINFVLGRLLNYTGVGIAGVSRATPIVASNPLFAALLAVTLGGETMNAPIAVGTVAIISGMVLVLSQR